jgi:hypothetical protein
MYMTGAAGKDLLHLLAAALGPLETLTNVRDSFAIDGTADMPRIPSIRRC